MLVLLVVVDALSLTLNFIVPMWFAGAESIGMFAIVVDSLALLMMVAVLLVILCDDISGYVMVVFEGEEFEDEDAEDDAEDDDKGSGVLPLLLLVML